MEGSCNFLLKKKKLNNKLQNKRFLITAGPTFEKIDPVRFIGNFSTGKMGFALAEALAEEGAEVVLIAGPVNLPTPKSEKIKRVDVLSADEMFKECNQRFYAADGAVMTAAVADYKPSDYSDKKIKRKKGNLDIRLSPNPDIAAHLGQMKKEGQLLVGFALETNNEEDNAFGKLQKKQLDFIVLNSLNDKGAGFGHDTNKISIIDKDNKKEIFELKNKKEVARDIVNKIIACYE